MKEALKKPLTHIGKRLQGNHDCLCSITAVQPSGVERLASLSGLFLKAPFLSRKGGPPGINSIVTP